MTIKFCLRSSYSYELYESDEKHAHPTPRRRYRCNRRYRAFSLHPGLRVSGIRKYRRDLEIKIHKRIAGAYVNRQGPYFSSGWGAGYARTSNNTPDALTGSDIRIEGSLELNFCNIIQNSTIRAANAHRCMSNAQLARMMKQLLKITLPIPTPVRGQQRRIRRTAINPSSEFGRDDFKRRVSGM